MLRESMSKGSGSGKQMLEKVTLPCTKTLWQDYVVGDCGKLDKTIVRRGQSVLSCTHVTATGSELRSAKSFTAPMTAPA